MRISFKDVGQGDSIIIEWFDINGNPKIGIIDCKLKGKANPVLKYIKTSNYKEISFLILSHPHEDHYSGFLELLEYLDTAQIIIKRMAHTLAFDGVASYWKYFEVNTQATNLLSSIKKKWFELIGNGLIERMDFLLDGKVMQIDEQVTITCLAPSPEDIQEYQRRVKLDAIKNEKEASQAANLLSTLLRISYEDYNYLLSSDTENFAFVGAWDREPHHIKGVKYHVCQMAHHGSVKNYNSEFWNNIDVFKIQNAIASAGNGYRHPSFKVLEAFYKNGYKVYCTNIVNGMTKFVAMLEEKSKLLDTFSESADEYRVSNDRIFEIKDGEVVLFNPNV